MLKALEKENLFSLGLELIDLNINDKNLGTYMLIGQISDEIIKKNNRFLMTHRLYKLFNRKAVNGPLYS